MFRIVYPVYLHIIDKTFHFEYSFKDGHLLVWRSHNLRPARSGKAMIGLEVIQEAHT